MFILNKILSFINNNLIAIHSSLDSLNYLSTLLKNKINSKILTNYDIITFLTYLKLDFIENVFSRRFSYIGLKATTNKLVKSTIGSRDRHFCQKIYFNNFKITTERGNNYTTVREISNLDLMTIKLLIVTTII